MGVAENKKVVLGFTEALSSADLEAVQAAFADDATWWFPGSLPWSGTHKGKKAILQDLFGQAFPFIEPGTLSIQVRNAIGEGDFVAAEWVVRCKNTKGRDYENYYHAMFEVKEGKIQTVREYVDTLHVKEVLLS
jgi:ketosteroid isomerase-like protein